MEKNRITFQFNPPSASHTGGVWERQIKTIKSILQGMATPYTNRLDTAGLRTSFYEAMASINSHPISCDNLHDSQEVILTPNHLLTLKSRHVLPPPGSFDRTDIYGSKMWRKAQAFAQEFWEKFKTGYMSEITKRQRWEKKEQKVKVGDVVLVSEDAIHRNQWATGTVIETISGADGLPRRAKIRLANKLIDNKGRIIAPAGILERHVSTLVYLFSTGSDKPPCTNGCTNSSTQ